MSLEIIRILLAILSGALATLAFAPFGWWPALAVSLLVLWQLWYARPDRAFVCGMFWGLSHFGTGVYWLYNSMHDHGQAHWLAAGLMTAAFVFYLSMLPAVSGWLAVRLERLEIMRYQLMRALSIATIWWFLEYLRATTIFGGFPWLASGFAQIDGFAGGAYPVLGVVGVGWLYLALIAVVHTGARRWWALGFPLRLRRRSSDHGGRGRGRRPQIAPASASIAVVAVVGAAVYLGARLLPEWTSPAGEEIQVSIVHTDLPQSQKFNAFEIRQSIDRNLELTRQAPPGLVVWPETAIPFYASRGGRIPVSKILEIAGEGEVEVITGIFHMAEPGETGRRGEAYNAVYSTSAPDSYYLKSKLVPFGEYLPAPGLFDFFRRYVEMPESDLSPGPADARPFELGELRVAANICFELFFSEVIHRQAPSSHLFVNVSNDAWFGRAVAPAQGTQMARTRAAETGRPIARASNQGISAVIDSDGRVLAQVEGDYQLISASVEPRKGLTPLMRYGDGGVIGAILALNVLAGLCCYGLIGRRRRARARG